MFVTPPHVGVLMGLILCPSCAGNHGCCEFVSALALLCLGDTSSSWSFLVLGSYTLSATSFVMFPEPWGFEM